MKKSVLKKVGILIGVTALIGGLTVFYMFNMPHRDVVSSSADFEIQVADLVAEYLDNPSESNQKYLDEEGDSKIIAVSGKVSSIDVNMNDQVVVVLIGDGAPAAVRCTFTLETNVNAQNIRVDEYVSIKGVIRSGASFDSDLDLYEDVILDKCDVMTSDSNNNN
jgi:hypothetical protein